MGSEHCLGSSYQSSGSGNSTISTSSRVMSFMPEHQLDALFLLDAPPVGLDGVQALGEADFFAFQVGHPVDVVPGAHHHGSRLRSDVRHPQEPGPAEVCMNVNGRGTCREADEVVEVVDVVRVQVVLAHVSEEVGT